MTPAIPRVLIVVVLVASAFITVMTLGWSGAVPMKAAELVNPHGDFIFRVTGTKSCNECHDFPAREGPPVLLYNAVVRELIARGKGAHGPNRFADCFRCHVGGHLDREKY